MKQFSDQKQRCVTVVEDDIGDNRQGKQPGHGKIDAIRHETPALLTGAVAQGGDQMTLPGGKVNLAIAFAGGLTK